MKLTAQHILTPTGWKERYTLEIHQGVITSVRPAVESEYGVMLPGKLVPGYIDTQVNGGGGVLFNQQPTPEGLRIMADAHFRFGTTGMLPTVITDNAQTMAQAADAVAAVLQSGHPTVLGIHFEGPFLSVKKKGVHSEEYIRGVSDEELAIIMRKDIGTVMVTVAPENVSADTISQLVANGVIVALGHTNATYEQAQKAIDAGASGFTHLHNAMSAMTSRTPGVVGAALANCHTFTGLIVDHHHVHPATALASIHAKGASKTVLVTDAMAHVGSDLIDLPFFGKTIHRDGDKLTTADGTLAGSCLDMHQAVINTHRDLGVSLADAVTMASSSAAAFCQLADKVGTIEQEKRADLLLLDSESLEIKGRWVAGQYARHINGSSL